MVCRLLPEPFSGLSLSYDIYIFMPVYGPAAMITIMKKHSQSSVMKCHNHNYDLILYFHFFQCHPMTHIIMVTDFCEKLMSCLAGNYSIWFFEPIAVGVPLIRSKHPRRPVLPQKRHENTQLLLPVFFTMSAHDPVSGYAMAGLPLWNENKNPVLITYYQPQLL